MLKQLGKRLPASERAKGFQADIGAVYGTIFSQEKAAWGDRLKDNTLRILTFTDLFPNAADPTHGVFVYQRTAHLARRSSNEVKVVAPVPYVPRWLKAKRWQSTAEIPEQEEFGGLTVQRPRYFLVPKVSMPFHGLSMFLGSLRTVMEIHRRWKIDLVDAHYVYPDGMAAVLIAKRLGVPVAVSARGTDINLFSTFPLIRPSIRWTLRHADALIAVSAALRQRMEELGADRSKIRLIPNGVDASRFRPVSSVEARRTLGLAESGPMIVTVGSLIPTKGHHLVIEAIRKLAARYEGLQLYIVGEGAHRRELERLAAGLELTGRVHFVGRRPNEELALWFSAASVSCLASAREGWPNVVTESLACGTPVVATRVGGIPEILESEMLGILVEPTVDSVAGGLERALNQTWDRGAISSGTRERTWDVVAEEVEELFGRLTET